MEYLIAAERLVIYGAIFVLVYKVVGLKIAFKKHVKNHIKEREQKQKENEATIRYYEGEN